MKELTFQSIDLLKRPIILRNNYINTASFHLTINNWSSSSTAEIILNINNMTDEFEGEPSYRKVWRFVRDVRYHFDPLSEESWIHSPSILLNSIGFGFCDDAATVTFALWKAFDFEARVIELMGHVVPEIKIGDRWEMYDPDLQVFYYLPNGSIAGVSDLEDNASLIITPITPILSPSHPLFETVYSASIANLYTTKTNNKIGDWYMNTLPQERAVDFLLPPGGNLTFPNKGITEFKTSYGIIVENYSTAKLTIPKGYTGPIRVPLVIQSVRGNSLIQIGEQIFSSDEEIQDFIDQRIDFIPEIYFIDATETVEIFYLLNPLLINWNETNTIQLKGFNLEGISFSYQN